MNKKNSLKNMEVILKELAQHNIIHKGLPIIIEECMKKYKLQMQNLTRQIKSTADLEFIYNEMERHEMGQIIAFYSLIILFFKEKRYLDPEFETEVIQYFIRLTIEDFKQSKQMFLLDEKIPNYNFFNSNNTIVKICNFILHFSSVIF